MASKKTVLYIRAISNDEKPAQSIRSPTAAFEGDER